MNLDLVKKLREKTGAGVLDCQNALKQTKGDIEKAIEILRKKGQKIVVSKSQRITKTGLIGIYHHSNEKIAAMVEVNCETDFVARNNEFKELAHDLAMQVAATNPSYLTPKDIPKEILKKEREIYKEEMKSSFAKTSVDKSKDKPEKILEKIIQGKLEKFYESVCLLKQPFIKDQNIKVEDLVKAKIAKLGENIQIKRFVRFEM